MPAFKNPYFLFFKISISFRSFLKSLFSSTIYFSFFSKNLFQNLFGLLFILPKFIHKLKEREVGRRLNLKQKRALPPCFKKSR